MWFLGGINQAPSVDCDLFVAEQELKEDVYSLFKQNIQWTGTPLLQVRLLMFAPC